MTTAQAIIPGGPMKYGAQELKKTISDNTIRAWILVTSALLLLLLFRWVYETVLRDWLFKEPDVVEVIVTRAMMDVLAPPPTNSNEPPPPPPPTNAMMGASGPASRAGVPVAVPDALIAPDAKDFANIDELNRASAKGGDGPDMGGFMDGAFDGGGQGLNVQKEEIPDPDDFVAYEVDPDIDYSGLLKLLVYPDMAKRNSIEGTVRVRVLVGKDGRPSKVQVLEGVNKLLDNEAMRAVQAATYTPAKQNGVPVSAWLTIPVVFKLK
jgi:TonB family protein